MSARKNRMVSDRCERLSADCSTGSDSGLCADGNGTYFIKIYETETLRKDTGGFYE